ncbi:hypothetical protein D3C76_1615790 [compost metagenome]
MPLRVKHAFGLIPIGADLHIDLAALHQPDRAGVGHAADLQLDAFRFEHCTQEVPAHALTVGLGVIGPLLAGRADLVRQRRRLGHPRPYTGSQTQQQQ